MKVWFGFAGLCLFAGSEWILRNALLGSLGGPARLATHYFMLAFVLSLAGLRGSQVAGRWVRVAGLGALLLGVPEGVVGLASAHMGGAGTVLVYMMVPAVVVFMTAQRAADFGRNEDRLWALGPALAGLGGGALLIPFALPAMWSGDVWLGAVVLSAVGAGIASVLLHRELKDTDLVPTAAALCVGAALVGVALLPWGDGLRWHEVQVWGELLQVVAAGWAGGAGYGVAVAGIAAGGVFGSLPPDSAGDDCRELCRHAAGDELGDGGGGFADGRGVRRTGVGRLTLDALRRWTKGDTLGLWQLPCMWWSRGKTRGSTHL